MKVRKAYKNIIGLVLIVGYIIFASVYVSKRYNELLCSGVKIEIDTNYAFVDKNVVMNMLHDGGMDLDSTVRIADIDYANIEKIVLQNPYIEDVQAYNDFTGNVFVKIKQRDPVVRVMTCDTVSFYLDSDNKIMPLCDYYTADVMVLSGNLKSKCFYSSDSVDNYSVNTDEKSLKINDICMFINYLQSDELWRNQISQIYVNRSNELELVPRVGSHIILLGGLDDYETKMNKLEAMYRDGFAITNWNAYSMINLKYKDQVICKKRNNG